MQNEYSMHLTDEEKAILEGKQGEAMRKALEFPDACILIGHYC